MNPNFPDGLLGAGMSHSLFLTLWPHSPSANPPRVPLGAYIPAERRINRPEHLVLRRSGDGSETDNVRPAFQCRVPSEEEDDANSGEPSSKMDIADLASPVDS
jgi:hypothetical protein